MKRLSPKKKWGQNFLRNRGAARQIVEALDARPGELVLEIGPGEGALTHDLAQLDCRLRLVEIDPELTARLAKTLGARAEIVLGDATETPLPDEPFKAVGNLPYNVATPIIRGVIASPGFRRAVFMVQKEVAERLLASPGDAEYGYLTVFRTLYADARRLVTLSPASFHPRPKVWSAVVVLTPATRRLRNDAPTLIALASQAFRMRRKTLVNNLSGWRGLSKPEAEACVATAGLQPAVRAEQLSLDDFDRLETAIAATKPGGGTRDA
jgi:16S rRNA (adenine1518-N6/adenine1519-N6)-dimethyltransferase